jgi:hypothetical protein
LRNLAVNWVVVCGATGKLLRRSARSVHGTRLLLLLVVRLVARRLRVFVVVVLLLLLVVVLLVLVEAVVLIAASLVVGEALRLARRLRLFVVGVLIEEAVVAVGAESLQSSRKLRLVVALSERLVFAPAPPCDIVRLRRSCRRNTSRQIRVGGRDRSCP